MMNAIVGGLALLLTVAVASAVSVIPSDEQFVKSLNGQWQFKLEQKGIDSDQRRLQGKPGEVVLPGKFEPFEKLTYQPDGTWKTLAVPGNWEIAGFSPPTYGPPDNAIGLYRLEFEVPAEWKDRVVKINFDGVQNGAEVYCNGQPVDVDEPSEGKKNFHQGGNTMFQADITPVVKYGEKNLLAIRVYKNTKYVDMDTGDFFFLGGIHRPVTLFAVPKAHISDVKVETKLNGEDAELKVKLAVADAKAGGKVAMQLEGFDRVEKEVGGDGKTELVQALSKPKLWTAEHPNLYKLTVTLSDESGKEIEKVSERVGVREITLKDGVFLINGTPVKFTGICRHDNYAPTGTYCDEALWRKDITMMKAANINAIRTSHYPYGKGFYDLCDELGMYVADEMAAGWVATNTRELTPAFEQHAREMVRRDKNHPSIVVWAIGNENKDGFNDKVAGDEIRKLDDTRPKLASCHKAEESGSELDDAHYTSLEKMKQYNEETERRKKYPFIYLEQPNNWEERNGADYGCLDAWAPVIDRMWKLVWDSPQIPGAFLWEWQDRAVNDQSPIKLYDYFPQSNTQLVKVKGLCDGYRDARAMLYQVNMAYAPVAVDLKPAVSGDSVTMHAHNRYSFTDLSELKTTWKLLKDEKEIKTGEAKLSLAPLSKGDLKLDLPGDALSQADAVVVRFENSNGNNVTYQLWLKPEPDTTPKLAGDVGDIKFPRFNLTAPTYYNNKNGWRMAAKHPAKLVNIKVGSNKVQDDAALYAMKLKDVPAMDAEMALAEKPKEVLGKVHATFQDGKFAYRVEWTKQGAATKTTSKGRAPKGEAQDIQEVGWIFSMPKSADHFSWHHQTYWSWYPQDHIGRRMGTATPDSADQDVSHITRPDAFDFNSTKYNCNWATLADGSGNGLGVTFGKDGRQHVRGGVGSDGYELVVNKICAPPRDISSNIVPDLYFTLDKGQKVEASFNVARVSKP